MSQQQVVPQMSFEEKIKEGLKENVGNLINDEDYDKILKALIHETFFKSKIIKVGDYGSTKTLPPVTEQVLVEAFTPHFKEVAGKAIEEWIAQHPEAITQVMETFLQKKMDEHIQSAIQSLVGSAFFMFGENLRTMLTQNIQNIPRY